MTVSTITFDFNSLHDFLSVLYTFWIDISGKSKPNKQELYEAYLVKKFYERTRKRHDNMLVHGQKNIRVKFDRIHAMLMVDILQRTAANKASNFVLGELGRFYPTQMR